MLVSPESDGPSGVLAELLAQRAREARREPLGELLAQADLLDEAEIEFALAHAGRAGRRLGEVLVEHGLVTPADVVRLVAEQRGLPFVDVASLPVDPAAAKLLPADQARSYRTVPIGFVRGLRSLRSRIRATGQRSTALGRSFAPRSSSRRRRSRSRRSSRGCTRSAALSGLIP